MMNDFTKGILSTAIVSAFSTVVGMYVAINVIENEITTLKQRVYYVDKKLDRAIDKLDDTVEKMRSDLYRPIQR